MTVSGFQAALAHILTSRPARAMLAETPEKIAEQFGLTTLELKLLAAADEKRLEINATAVTAKRLDFLRRALPATLDFLVAGSVCHHRLLAMYTDGCLPEYRAEQPSRMIAESERFVDFLLQADIPVATHISDFARFELLRLKLAFSSEASTDAQHARQQALGRRGLAWWPLETEAHLRLGQHVLLGQFGFDMPMLYDRYLQTGTLPNEGEQQPTWLAIVKARGGAFALYRLGERTHVVLARWRTPCHVMAMQKLLATEAVNADRVLDIARFALGEALLIEADKRGGS
jgi:hypothetical protein